MVGHTCMLILFPWIVLAIFSRSLITFVWVLGNLYWTSLQGNILFLSKFQLNNNNIKVIINNIYLLWILFLSYFPLKTSCILNVDWCLGGMIVTLPTQVQILFYLHFYVNPLFISLNVKSSNIKISNIKE